MNTRIVYKIYDPESGLYSKGGQQGYPGWSKKGKTWNTLGALHNHMSGVNVDRCYSDCQLVRIQITEEDAGCESVTQHYAAYSAERQAKEDRSAARAREKREAHEIRKAEALLKKHGRL